MARVARDDLTSALTSRHQAERRASATLTEIYKRFTEGFDTADLKDAKALLDELNN